MKQVFFLLILLTASPGHSSLVKLMNSKVDARKHKIT